MSEIRNYINYDTKLLNTKEYTDLIHKWIQLIKTKVLDDRKIILILPTLDKLQIENLTPYFNHQFVKCLIKENSAIFEGNIFSLYSPQTYKNIILDEDYSCIAFFIREEDLFPLEDRFGIKEILLIPWPNLAFYKTYQKGSKQFIKEEDFILIEPDFNLDLNIKNKLITVIESSAICMTQNIEHPSDIIKIKEGLRVIKQKYKNIIPLKDDLIGYLLYEYKNSKTNNKGCKYHNVEFIIKYLF